ncbi:MAG: carbon-monoxide dehydrogenase medium subunit [Gammaproteobacteria bacterium]|jgi:carbon-monoxide dehydrogenase medium subunit
MRYESPATTKEAVALLAKEKGQAFVLAGGTDLLVRMKTGQIEPALIVDIKRIPEMTAITATRTGFRIGAAVTGAQLLAHRGLCKSWPGVVEATNLIGSDQIQGRCSMVGNLCNASPAADSVPAMIAARAKAIIVSAGGRRKILVEKIVTGPGRTSLKKGELIEAIELPAPAKRCADAYLRFTPRTEMDIAVVGVSISLTLERGVVAKARVCLGAVAPTAILVPAAASALVGSKLDDAALAKCAAACSNACSPLDDKRGTVAFRTRVAGVLARRAAKIAYQRAGGAA